MPHRGQETERDSRTCAEASATPGGETALPACETPCNTPLVYFPSTDRVWAY